MTSNRRMTWYANRNADGGLAEGVWTIGAITPIVLALEQALIALLAISCPQFRNGFNERFARRLPDLVRWANQLADARGYCAICGVNAVCEPQGRQQ